MCKNKTSTQSILIIRQLNTLLYMCSQNRRQPSAAKIRQTTFPQKNFTDATWRKHTNGRTLAQTNTIKTLYSVACMRVIDAEHVMTCSEFVLCIRYFSCFCLVWM